MMNTASPHPDDPNQSHPVAADWVLTGASRLITCAPGVCSSATGRLGVIDRGALAARAGHIVWVGPEDKLAAAVDLAEVAPTARFSAGGLAVLPGFVDSHTHFLFAGDRADEFALRHSGVSYEEVARQGGGIMKTVRETRGATAETLSELGRHRLESFVIHGTTTVEGKTGYGLDLATEERCLDIMEELSNRPGLPTVVPTFLGAHTIAPEYRESARGREHYIASISEEMLPRFRARARFCDVFCERTAFSDGRSKDDPGVGPRSRLPTKGACESTWADRWSRACRRVWRRLGRPSGLCHRRRSSGARSGWRNRHITAWLFIHSRHPVSRVGSLS